jgi:hypothetical protein
MNLTLNVLSTDFNTETPLAIPAGGISINGDANLGASDTHSVEVSDFGEAELLVSVAGYLPYNMTIDNVFSEDLSLDVILVQEITDIEAPNYLRSRPNFFVIKDPCSYCVYYYYASSNFGNVSWLINNKHYENGQKGVIPFAASGSYQIKVRNRSSESHVDTESGELVCGCGGQPSGVDYESITYSWDQQFANIHTGNTVSGDIDDIEVYLALDTQTNITIEEYRASITTNVSSGIEPLQEQDSQYYFRDDEITITPTIEITRGVADDYTVYYKTVDPRGVTIVELAQPFGAPIEPVYFKVEELGVYTTEIRLVDNICGLTYETTVAVETTNFIDIEYTDCSTFRVTNYSSDRVISYQISDIADASFNVQGTLSPGNSFDTVLTSVSLYYMDVTYTEDNVETEERYVLNNYCQIELCMADYIESIICEEGTNCDPCPEESTLNQMILFYNTYFMKLHKYFQKNTYFTALADSDLDELLTLKGIMDKIASFCDRLHCTKGTDGAFNAYQAEGPYDWAGQGNNHKKNCACPPKYYNNGSCKKCGS